jgi:hypothetical protein
VPHPALVKRMVVDVTILDIYENAASAKTVMAERIDYLQLARAIPRTPGGTSP